MPHTRWIHPSYIVHIGLCIPCVRVMRALSRSLSLHFLWRLINFARFCLALRTQFAPMYSHFHVHSLILPPSLKFGVCCFFLLICLPSFGVVVIETIHVLINFQTTTKYFILLYCCCRCWWCVSCFVSFPLYMCDVRFFFFHFVIRYLSHF